MMNFFESAPDSKARKHGLSLARFTNAVDRMVSGSYTIILNAVYHHGKMQNRHHFHVKVHHEIF